VHGIINTKSISNYYRTHSIYSGNYFLKRPDLL
jgi:hypothetical protein